MNKQVFDTNTRWVNIHKLNSIINNIYTVIENGGISPTGKIYFGEPVQNKEDLPKNKEIGYVALVISELKLYVFDGRDYQSLNNDCELASIEDIENLFK